MIHAPMDDEAQRTANLAQAIIAYAQTISADVEARAPALCLAAAYEFLAGLPADVRDHPIVPKRGAEIMYAALQRAQDDLRALESQVRHS
jgi:hypothetical protein